VRDSCPPPAGARSELDVGSMGTEWLAMMYHLRHSYGTTATSGRLHQCH
jgi:hypothetical protein